jgi:hypothetical protein
MDNRDLIPASAALFAADRHRQLDLLGRQILQLGLQRCPFGTSCLVLPSQARWQVPGPP